MSAISSPPSPPSGPSRSLMSSRLPTTFSPAESDGTALSWLIRSNSNSDSISSSDSISISSSGRGRSFGSNCSPTNSPVTQLFHETQTQTQNNLAKAFYYENTHKSMVIKDFTLIKNNLFVVCSEDNIQPLEHH